MKTQTIEVEGLPEDVVITKVKCVDHPGLTTKQWLVFTEKIQPRRIVLEETEEKHLGCQTLYIDDTEFMIMTDKVWREVKETDDEPKLSLSVEECRNVRSLIKDFENLGWFVNPERALLLQKITEFIKDKS